MVHRYNDNIADLYLAFVIYVYFCYTITYIELKFVSYFKECQMVDMACSEKAQSVLNAQLWDANGQLLNGLNAARHAVEVVALEPGFKLVANRAQENEPTEDHAELKDVLENVS